MATGTGKTITSLLCAANYYKEEGRMFLIIFVPFTHLIPQWENELIKIGFDNVLKCFDLKKKWMSRLDGRVRDFNIGISTKECIITTYKTASSKEFNMIISDIRGKSFLIADECHYFGIKSLRNHSLHNITCKIGLSATPDRWWDEKGTSRLKPYFGDVIYEYDMKKAIEKNVLTEYKYNPIPTQLVEDEIEKYAMLTNKIIYMLSENYDQEEIEKVSRERAMILSKAVNKKEQFFEMIKNEKLEDIAHTLVYCAPGDINEITLGLSELGLRVHRFDSKVEMKDREKILEAFADKKIQVLAAIKCLDEGVDVPSTRRAYFLASTSNPREFIQRRGRILRNAKGKNLAEIYDFIILPENSHESVFESIVRKEMPRFAEFSRFAINNYTARKIVKPILEKYDLEYLMDKLPWELYHEMKEMWEEKRWN